jgi:hypothetical protein
MKLKKKSAFDAQLFLQSAGASKRVEEFREEQAICSQGESADSIGRQDAGWDFVQATIWIAENENGIDSKFAEEQLAIDRRDLLNRLDEDESKKETTTLRTLLECWDLGQAQNHLPSFFAIIAQVSGGMPRNRLTTSGSN